MLGIMLNTLDSLIKSSQISCEVGLISFSNFQFGNMELRKVVSVLMGICL